MTTTPGQGGRVAGSAAYARTRPGTASKVTSGIGGAYVTRWGGRRLAALEGGRRPARVLAGQR